MEHICDKLSRMCARITTTQKFDTRALCCMVGRNHSHVCTCIRTYFRHIPCIVMKFMRKTYPRKFELWICKQLWEIIHIPCMESPISAFLHNVTHYTLFFIVMHPFNIVDLNVMCTLVAASMMLERSECIPPFLIQSGVQIYDIVK